MDPVEAPEVELGSEEEVELEDVPTNKVEVGVTATKKLDVVKAATEVSCTADEEIAGLARTADVEDDEVDCDPKVEATRALVEDTAADVDDSSMAGFA